MFEIWYWNFNLNLSFIGRWFLKESNRAADWIACWMNSWRSWYGKNKMYRSILLKDSLVFLECNFCSRYFDCLRFLRWWWLVELINKKEMRKEWESKVLNMYIKSCFLISKMRKEEKEKIVAHILLYQKADILPTSSCYTQLFCAFISEGVVDLKLTTLPWSCLKNSWCSAP